MRIYASPRRGYCASCEMLLTGRPVYHMDETYCCLGCAQGGPCVCSYEADLASDGVDRLGLPFAEPVVETTRTAGPAAAPVGDLAPAR
ncbi:MAG TPA: hypothetical protein VF494_12565 [Candidatus Limnocylindrales bacterium]